MIKIVWRTDVHMSDRSPESRVDDWVDTVLGKLGQVRDIADQHRAALILDGGDFFHNKSPTRNSHETLRRVIDHHSSYPCPVFVTPGNHDSVYGDYAFLGQQPLGVLFSSGVFKRLYDDHEVFIAQRNSEKQAQVYPFHKEGGFIGKSPFDIADKDLAGPIIRVVGVPYHGTHYDMERFTSIQKGGEDILICVGHVLASLKGGSMFEGEDIIKYSDLVDTAPDVFLFGHWHKDQGVEKIGDKTFINIGSLTRGSLSQDNVQRRPACAVLSCTEDGVGVEVVRLKVEPVEKVFNIERRAQQVKRQTDMDTFVASIREVLVQDDEAADVKDTIRGYESVPQEIRERALAYLEQVEG